MSYDCDIMSSIFFKDAHVTKISVFHFKVGTIKDHIYFSCTTIQFSSVTQSCPTLCDPMDCSTPGLPVHHQLLELAQTHVH